MSRKDRRTTTSARLSRIISLSVKRYPGHHHFLFFLNHPSVPAGAMVQNQQLNGVEAFSKRPGHAGIWLWALIGTEPG